ncbi:MAG: hypothetical protein JWO66_1605 [Candidatus Eremiobacteraeota bacterium]|nr:hypothetical protein [Candidatus Eremiobacteraeota bacterium]
MTVGKLARKVLGPAFFTRVAHYYRAFFVNLAKVVDTFAREIPQGAHVVDVGGGDGAPLNYLLQARPDITISMLDLAPSIGGAIEPRFETRTRRLPGVSIADYLASGGARADAVIVSDVVHHVPVEAREEFFRDLGRLAATPGTVVMIKDVEPSGARAWLSYLADRYISGDRRVSLISRGTLRGLLSRHIDNASIREGALYRQDAPNYVLVAVTGGAAPAAVPAGAQQSS